ncbi:Por secretion system C-terminal sorting domain-containing protein [Chitinophaga sp. CF118]|uniref:S8 family serine peptidase n=1 Tax=Chitinophaga sp. CF118 TaxID=1884367 RepID=UPI0008EF90A7|nr:S8 family serine peptidase [Chitinophaga sp. CF118]SFE86403.1 Por secretion system C-terminal sorting domain-containing protein [Chitinophaga sp. CF118]
MSFNLRPHFIIVITLLISIYPDVLKAQVPRYIISFKDKQKNPFSLSEPPAFLSQRAIERRNRQHISIDSADLPVTPAYIDSIAKSGNIKILYTSRWFNYVAIQTNDVPALEKIRHYSFVNSTDTAGVRHSPLKNTRKKFMPDSLPVSVMAKDADISMYGKAAAQIHLHEGEFLHNSRYKGENILIALLDAGFSTVDKNRAFLYLRENNRIVGTYDFVNTSANVYKSDNHGTECLSILASMLPGEMIGTAPDAEYLLMRTEDETSEQPIEENNWIAAVEYADSMGADIISSALGYNTFDSPYNNYTYSQLDGHTTQVARATEIAVSKGMIIVNAAGNEGNTDWKYILSPADADNILTVGAIDIHGAVAAFSGKGPTSDNRIKPDVVSLGIGTQFIDTSGNIKSGLGTSYACPVITGLTACLWQAFPDCSNLEILKAIKASSSRYTTPDNKSGYGVPNFHTAFDLLLNKQWQDSIKIRESLVNSWIKSFPNPFTDKIKVYLHNIDGKAINLLLYNSAGQLVKHTSFTIGKGYIYYEWPEDLSKLSSGIYYLRAKKGNDKVTIKLLKL